MQPVKSVFGLVGAVIPVLWLGGLAYYFYGTNQAMGGIATKELGPTIIGLSVIAGLFAIPLLFRLMKLVAGGSTKPVRNVDSGGIDTEESGFDADAALARYLARKAANGGEVPSYQPAPASRPGGFGRKQA